MSILHTLNASPSSSAFTDCMKVATTGDAILLMGDGVYAAIKGTQSCSLLLASGAEIHLLQGDARAAGVTDEADGVIPVDMDGFVALTERFSRQLAWY